MDGQQSSEAFRHLHPKIQQWIYREGWEELHFVQEQAALPILSEEKDVVIAAATAGGKTEAAFFPVATRIAEDWESSDVGAFSVLCISPLKALINDQFDRLEEIFAPLHVPVFRWHGDVSAGKKRRARQQGGVLLITPESLEAQMIRRGHLLSDLFGPLRYVVIDELHAFIGLERGRQLQSLLHRVEMTARKRIPRIGLSATLGDMNLACEFLRPGDGESVCQITDEGGSQEVRLQIRGYENESPAVKDDSRAGDHDSDSQNGSNNRESRGDVAIAKHLFHTLRGGRHIVFANRRSDVEVFSDLLRRLSKRNKVPNEFEAHHGSLSRELRKEAEERLRSGREPATIIATSTLELGIDVGSVESVGQIGPPLSVASMRQRLGRSGRRGDDASILRIYVREPELRPDSPPIDRLRVSLVRTVAMVRLLADGWFEPPITGALHLSTLVQQVLSLIAQHGGLDARQGYDALCRRGPFRSVTPHQYALLLKDLGEHELIKQIHDGTLVLDLEGEQLVNHYDFYAAFSAPEEYRLVAKRETVGSLPIIFPVAEGSYLIFGGRRWKVLEVDAERKVIQLRKAAGGKPPVFGGSGALVRSRIRKEMLTVYESDDEPAYLNNEGIELLREARKEFRLMGLHEQPFWEGRDLWWFPWTGDRALNALMLELRERNMDVGQEGPALRLDNGSAEELRETIGYIRDSGFSNPEELAKLVENKEQEKHHRFLREELLAADYASAKLAPEEAKKGTLTGRQWKMPK